MIIKFRIKNAAWDVPFLSLYFLFPALEMHLKNPSSIFFLRIKSTQVFFRRFAHGRGAQKV